MRQIYNLAIASLLFGSAIVAGQRITNGQEPTTNDPISVAEDDSVPRVTLSEAEAALADLEKDSSVEETQKTTLKATYEEITDHLQTAEVFAGKSSAYKAAIETAPKRTLENRNQLETLPPAEKADDIAPEGGAAEIRKEREARQAALQALSDQLELVNGEILKTDGRPIEIGTRLPEAQRELSAISNRWASADREATTQKAKADRLLIQAEYTRLSDEIEMMRQEQVSQSVREEELVARRDLLSRQVENLRETIDGLGARLKAALASDVDRIFALADVPQEDLPEDSTVKELAAEVRLLAEQFKSVVETLKKVIPASREVSDRLEDVRSEYRDIRNELSLRSGGRELAQVLLELSRRASPTALKLQVPISVDRARLDLFSVKRKQRAQPLVENQLSDQSSALVKRLLDARAEILDRLLVENNSLTQALVEHEIRTQEYLDLCDEIQAYVSETLFGFNVRSCPVIGIETLTEIPAGLIWLLDAERWTEFRGVLFFRFNVMAAATALAILLLLLRRRLISALEATRVPIRRISTDRFSWTFKALVLTMLLAAPLPLFAFFLSWVCSSTPNPSDWLVGVAKGFDHTFKVLSIVLFMVEVCRPRGLGISHFKWDEKVVACCSRTLVRIGVVYVPMILLSFSVSFGEASRYAESVGRVAFIFAHVWVVYVLWRMLQRMGDLVDHATASSSRLLQLYTSIRYPLLIGTPLVLIALACLGYLITAANLSYGLMISIGIVAVGRVLFRTSGRWFEIRQRRIAFAEALESRKARLTAAEDGSEAHVDELLQLDEEEEMALDLDEAGQQTIAFLRLLFNLGILLVLSNYWSSAVPLAAALNAIPLVGAITALSLSKAIIVGVVTFVAIRNLPGLLEVSVLRTTTMEAGTRNAVYTLCQYGVTGLSLIAISAILKLDWSQLGWMAAALSVGLGFGLQEVVSNFVCGLILLFERPIRVGDVVTIDGTTGTVSYINLRATTITNWDRQDLVVPNKTLITGNILNWTLSEALNRVVIPVGVAYGTDTDEALQILLDVAADNPEVLDDPKPFATFEQFADSSLNLILRAYLPSLDNRASVITSLHTEIARRFKEEGIEIPFPQQEMHIRHDVDSYSDERVGELPGDMG